MSPWDHLKTVITESDPTGPVFSGLRVARWWIVRSRRGWCVLWVFDHCKERGPPWSCPGWSWAKVRCEDEELWGEVEEVGRLR